MGIEYPVIQINPDIYAHGSCFGVICCGLVIADFSNSRQGFLTRNFMIAPVLIV